MTDTSITPAEKRRLKVRDSIIAAAERVFAQEGEAGLSIRRLAKKIDYSPAAIYKYFASKDDLVDELKDAFFDRLLAQIHRIADKETAFSTRMADCLATYVQEGLSSPHHYAAAFVGTAKDTGLDASHPDFTQQSKGRAFRVLMGMMEEGIDLGHFRDNLDPELAAKSIWASLHGLTMMMIHIPTYPRLSADSEAPDRETFIQMHADHLVRGLESRNDL
ncbi:MAG: TetR/AcrR family transcriptional regulator [Pseudomonadota bacterium]